MYNSGCNGAGSDFATCVYHLSDYECFSEIHSGTPIAAQFKFLLMTDGVEKPLAVNSE
jgi:hypothetical protein